MGLEDHGLFRLTNSDDSRDLAMVSQWSVVSTLWHQQYGHLNVHYLSQLACPRFARDSDSAAWSL